jgi:hypothetical protein
MISPMLEKNRYGWSSNVKTQSRDKRQAPPAWKMEEEMAFKALALELDI